MPARNRVSPWGTIDAIAQRGEFTGNRGILHRDRQLVRTHANPAWLVCTLHYRDRHHEQWRPGHLTWLYFYDEAVALAAGHRPCARCRRPAYNCYRAAWVTAFGSPTPSAMQIDRQLDRERRVPRTSRQRTHRATWSELPDGTFVDVDDDPCVVLGTQLVRWTAAGYDARRGRPRTGEVTVLTPESTVAVLAAGYPVDLSRASRPEPSTAAGRRDS